MLERLTDFTLGDPGQDPVALFQQNRSISDDAELTETRRLLITEYMNEDRTTAPADTTLVAHGCGESFPASGSGDSTEVAEDRRVEMFIFDGPVEPPPPGSISGPDSTEYPQWLSRATEVIDLTELATPFQFSV